MVRVSPGCPAAPPGARPARPAAPRARDAADLRAAGAVQRVRGGIRRVDPSRRPRGRRDQLRRVRGGTPRGVGLVRVVQLDDLDGLEERRGHLRRSCIISTAPMAKFGAISTSTPCVARASARTGRGAPRRTRRCRLRRHPVLDAPAMLSMTAPGWVKSTTTSRPSPPAGPARRPGRLRDELQLVSRLDGPARLGTHAPARAQHADLDRTHRATLVPRQETLATYLGGPDAGQSGSIGEVCGAMRDVFGEYKGGAFF